VTTFEELLAQAKRPGTSVSLCLRGDLTTPYRELEHRLRTASREAPSLGQRSDAAVIAEQMRALETQMAEATTTFTLEAMHPKAWSDLYNARPQRGKDETDDDWNVRWFGWVCEVVARTVTGPVKMTAEQVGQLCDVLSGGQWDELSETAWGLNSEKVTVPFSVAASALIPPSGQS
jgi:hypothetical protein